MRGVDLDTFRFDFDLTFAVLLMHPDGTVYHRYAGRDSSSPMAWLSMPSLIRTLRRGLATHEAYQASGARREATSPRTLDDIPAWQRKVAERERQQKPIACYHCHFVPDAERVQLQDEGRWSPDLIWRWPAPARAGVLLDKDEQERVVGVLPDSPAAAAGLEPGDRLLTLGDQRVVAQGDVSWVLEQTPWEGGALPLRLARGDVEVTTELRLAPGWRRGTPRDFAWRPSKWQLRPRPGFGGRPLSAEEKRELDLPPDGFAFRVGYLVTWGEDPRYGRAAKRAGIRKGDVVVRVGEADLDGPAHFHAWWRLTRTPGDRVQIDLLRSGKRRTVELEVLSDPE
jgi:hypothetical protein